jgi:lactose/L-arabinose transport system ATP-binding protein
VTLIYVTDDQVEAMTLADKIVVLRAGNIEQIGRPLELYDDPDNQFVAGFVGSPKMNFLRATVVGWDAKGAALEFADQGMTRLVQPLAGAAPEVGSKVVVGVRAEHFGAAGQGDADLKVKVDVVEHLGSTSFLYARTASGEDVVIEHQGTDAPAADGITVSIQRSYLFDSSGQRLR